MCDEASVCVYMSHIFSIFNVSGKDNVLLTKIMCKHKNNGSFLEYYQCNVTFYTTSSYILKPEQIQTKTTPKLIE